MDDTDRELKNYLIGYEACNSWLWMFFSIMPNTIARYVAWKVRRKYYRAIESKRYYITRN